MFTFQFLNDKSHNYAFFDINERRKKPNISHFNHSVAIRGLSAKFLDVDLI